MSKTPTININLLPPERRRIPRLDALVIILFLLVGASTVACAAYSQHLMGQAEQRKVELARLDQETKQLEASLPIIEERRAKVAQLKGQLDMIRSLVKDPQRYAAILREVSRLMPANLWLSNLSIEPSSQTVSVEGTVAETTGHLPLATVSQFLAAVQRSPLFRDPSLKSTSHTKLAGDVAGYTFAVEFHYDPQAAGR